MQRQINRVTIHPIDTKLLDKLNINRSNRVTNTRLGGVLARLIKAGYDNVQVANYHDDYNRLVICYHCKKNIF